DRERFERLWRDEDPNVRVFDLPEAAREQILKLRTEQRPYPLPEHIRERAGSYTFPEQPRRPSDLRLREYQEQAIRAWFASNCRGIFDMATGTGKTISALAAMVRLFGHDRRLAVIITCPYQHLVDQWNEEAASFGLQSILAYQRKQDWLRPLNQQIA